MLNVTKWCYVVDLKEHAYVELYTLCNDGLNIEKHLGMNRGGEVIINLALKGHSRDSAYFKGEYFGKN